MDVKERTTISTWDVTYSKEFNTAEELIEPMSAPFNVYLKLEDVIGGFSDLNFNKESRLLSLKRGLLYTQALTSLEEAKVSFDFEPTIYSLLVKHEIQTDTVLFLDYTANKKFVVEVIQLEKQRSAGELTYIPELVLKIKEVDNANSVSTSATSSL